MSARPAGEPESKRSGGSSDLTAPEAGGGEYGLEPVAAPPDVPPGLPPEMLAENERIASVRQRLAQRITDDGLFIEELSTAEPLYGLGHDLATDARYRYTIDGDDITKEGVE